jgi:hypothetical protein
MTSGVTAGLEERLPAEENQETAADLLRASIRFRFRNMRSGNTAAVALRMYHPGDKYTQAADIRIDLNRMLVVVDEVHSRRSSIYTIDGRLDPPDHDEERVMFTAATRFTTTTRPAQASRLRRGRPHHNSEPAAEPVVEYHYDESSEVDKSHIYELLVQLAGAYVVGQEIVRIEE